MSNPINDPLFRLIKSLSKSEKRNFTLYVNRIQDTKEVKFVQLFEVLDRQKEYQEKQIFQKIPDLKKSQLSNIRRHLYKQLLISLRMINIQVNVDLAIREQIDFAKILYNKGFYKDSLKILERAKGIAINAHQDLLHLEILEFEKLIELRHITRSSADRAEVLSDDAVKRASVINTSSKLSNLSLRLYGLYIKIGHIKQQKDYYMLSEFFRSNLPTRPESEMTFFEKITLYQCHYWYNHILLNFVQGYKYAQKWVDLFEQDKDMQGNDPELYMQGFNNLLSSLFYTGYYSKFEENLKRLEEFGEAHYKSFNKNEKVQYFLYLNSHRINNYFMQGAFSEGVEIVPELKKKLGRYQTHLDQHRIMVFYYRIACLYFGNGNNNEAIDYLNKIINFSMGHLGEDIQCFARILNLIAHYELGHYNLLEHLVKSVYRFLRKMEELNAVQEEILRFLRKSLNTNPQNLTESFVKLRTRLIPHTNNPVERRSFLYLDIISWLTSKIEGRPVQAVIREKFKMEKR